MRNSPGLPIVALVVALALAAIAAIDYWSHPARHPFSLDELEIGLVAWAIALAIYGLQGLISVVSEGAELHVGRSAPRLTGPLSLAILIFSLLLLADAVVLAIGIASGWRAEVVGILAGLGCLDLAALLAFYKEGFIGDEACLDDIADDVPW
jgi:hypothetical protein